MSFIEEIARIYDETPLSKITVPEWRADIYYKPLTPIELDCARKEVNDADVETVLRTQLVILKSLDQSGKRLFENSNAQTLREKGSALVIDRIAEKMRKVTTVEDAEGN